MIGYYKLNKSYYLKRYNTTNHHNVSNTAAQSTKWNYDQIRNRNSKVLFNKITVNEIAVICKTIACFHVCDIHVA